MRYVVDLLGLAIIIAASLRVWGSYRQLPERIPIHFGFSGEPDGWGPRWMIWLLPVVALFSFVLITVVQGLDARIGNSLGLDLLKLEHQALFGYLVWAQLEVALGRATRLGPAIWGFLVLILITAPFVGR